MSKIHQAPIVHGIVVLDKPLGMTSARALYRVRKIVGEKKSGHGGTLDPQATGVLVLCFGWATRLFEMLRVLPKVYRATARLDVTSDSFDTERTLQPVEPAAIPTREQVAAALATFVGEIMQVPPNVSAVKVGGKPAYERERNDEEFELAPKRVTIYWIHLHRYEWPVVDFEMCCGGGTYIRAIARDLGTQLGTGGCLTTLRRLCVGPFTLKEAWKLEELEKLPMNRYFVPLEEATATIQAASGSVPPLPAS